MRLEKGYRAFGRELTPEYGPVQAGLLFACKLRGGVPFLGREAVEKARAEGPRRRLVSVLVGDPDREPGPAGGRPVGAGARPCCGAASWCCATGWRSAS